MNRRILIVDDLPDIHRSIEGALQPPRRDAQLDALEADLFGDAPETPSAEMPVFEVAHAHQGQEALQRVHDAVEANTPFAMAFVDMRMPPGWDGLTTIRQLWQVDPHLQIAICTAYSDHSWDEIREGLGHREQVLVLKKPFEPIEVAQMALALTRKWNEEAAQRALLADTLGGAIGVMGELLSLAQPTVSERVRGVRQCVAHLVEALGLEHWAYDLAAGLCQIGCITLPEQLVESMMKGTPLTADELEMVERHPMGAAQLVRQIPRLELVARIVELQLDPPEVDWNGSLENDDEKVVAIGAQLLHASLTVTDAIRRDESLSAARQQLHFRLARLLEGYRPCRDCKEIYVRMNGVAPGMVLVEPIVVVDSGVVVCAAGTVLTLPMLERLRNFSSRVELQQPFRVRL